jgi:hypothetical protein
VYLSKFKMRRFLQMKLLGWLMNYRKYPIIGAGGNKGACDFIGYKKKMFLLINRIKFTIDSTAILIQIE